MTTPDSPHGPELVASSRAYPITAFLPGATSPVELGFPVLVSCPGSGVEHVERALVHPLPALRWRPGGALLADEIGRLEIGRTSDNDIAIDDTTVSRHHATLIVQSGGRWSLVDAGSMNGTFADGRRLEPHAPLPLVGGCVLLRVGSRHRLSFLDAAPFRECLATLEKELSRQRARSTVAGAGGSPRVAPSWSNASDEYLGARILDAVRSAPFVAHAYRVRVAGAVVDDFADWADLVAFVEQNAARVLALEVLSDDHRRHVVYRRDLESRTETSLPCVSPGEPCVEG